MCVSVSVCVAGEDSDQHQPCPAVQLPGLSAQPAAAQCRGHHSTGERKLDGTPPDGRGKLVLERKPGRTLRQKSGAVRTLSYLQCFFTGCVSEERNLASQVGTEKRVRHVHSARICTLFHDVYLSFFLNTRQNRSFVRSKSMYASDVYCARLRPAFAS